MLLNVEVGYDNAPSNNSFNRTRRERVSHARIVTVGGLCAPVNSGVGLLVDSSVNLALVSVTSAMSRQLNKQPSALVSVEHGRQFFAFGNESNGEGVNAVAGVFICQTFALEDVA